jgi:hypothetical protein
MITENIENEYTKVINTWFLQTDDPILVLKQILVAINLQLDSLGDVRIDIIPMRKYGDYDIDCATGALKITDIEGRMGLKETTIGSNSVRYFTTDTDTDSKIKEIETMGQYFSELDKEIIKIKKLRSFPEELINIDFKANVATYQHPLLPSLSATPDGVCIIGGILSPIEVASDSNFLEAETFLKKRPLSRKRGKGARHTTMEEWIDTSMATDIASNKARSKELKKLSKEKQQEHFKKKKEQEVFRKQKKMEEKERIKSLRDGTSVDSHPSLRQMSIDASNRYRVGEYRYSNLCKQNNFNPSGSSNSLNSFNSKVSFEYGVSPAVYAQKKIQLESQMIAMRSRHCLLVHRTPTVVHYQVYERPAGLFNKFVQVTKIDPD